MRIDATKTRIEATNSRRIFITGLTTLSAGMLLHGCRSASPLPAASAAAPHGRGPAAGGAARQGIDVNHHWGPRTYVAALSDKGIAQRPMIEWTAAKSLEDMDKAGVATAVTSITIPASRSWTPPPRVASP